MRKVLEAKLKLVGRKEKASIFPVFFEVFLVSCSGQGKVLLYGLEDEVRWSWGSHRKQRCVLLRGGHTPKL